MLRRSPAKARRRTALRVRHISAKIRRRPPCAPRPGKARRQTFPPPSPGLWEGRPPHASAQPCKGAPEGCPARPAHLCKDTPEAAMRPRPGKARRQTFPPPSPGLWEGRPPHASAQPCKGAPEDCPARPAHLCKDTPEASVRPRPGKARRQTFPPPSHGLREGRRAMRMRLFQRAGSHRCTASTASSTRPPFPARRAAPLALVSSGDGQRQFAKSRSDVRTCSQPPRSSKPFPARGGAAPPKRGRFPCFSNLFRRRGAAPRAQSRYAAERRRS